MREDGKGMGAKYLQELPQKFRGVDIRISEYEKHRGGKNQHQV
jgi:hypothetical protein